MPLQSAGKMIDQLQLRLPSPRPPSSRPARNNRRAVMQCSRSNANSRSLNRKRAISGSPSGRTSIQGSIASRSCGHDPRPERAEQSSVDVLYVHVPLPLRPRHPGGGFGRRGRMTDRSDPIQVAAAPHKSKPDQHHREENAQVHQRQRATERDEASDHTILPSGPPTSRRRHVVARWLQKGQGGRGKRRGERGKGRGNRSMPYSLLSPFLSQQCSPCLGRLAKDDRRGRKIAQPRPRRSKTPAPRHRTGGRTGPFPAQSPARRIRRSPTSSAWARRHARTSPIEGMQRRTGTQPWQKGPSRPQSRSAASSAASARRESTPPKGHSGPKKPHSTRFQGLCKGP